MSMKEFMKKLDIWMRNQNHLNLQKKADKLELDAKYAKINAPYKKRIDSAKKTIKANTPKTNPLDMSMNLD
jgi:hypothetical protein